MLTKVLIALIRVYQLTLSRLLVAAFGPACRFEPSCSRYAVACLEGQGALRGTLLSVKRLCKCHPFHPGGYDPPPPPRSGRASKIPLPEGAPPPDGTDAGHAGHTREAAGARSPCACNG
jgi:putative membrane protein insertion efficiency factor